VAAHAGQIGDAKPQRLGADSVRCGSGGSGMR
jgi:hypothetical protein